MPLAIVTTGPSSAPIDAVRRITNFATGEIGALLAAALLRCGFEVVLFRGRGATHDGGLAGLMAREFETNHELARALEQLAEARGHEVCAVFHAAALSDYAVAGVRGPNGAITHAQKIPGNLARIELVLEPAAKVLPRLRGWFSRARITGWKYELEGARTEALAAAQQQLAAGRTDCTVLNGEAYGPGFAVLEEGKSPTHFSHKSELADFLASQATTFAKASL